MNDIDVQVLARAVPAPRPIELSDLHKERLAEQIARRIDRSDVRRRRAATIGPVVLVAACFASVVGLVTVNVGGASAPPASTHRPVAAAPGAVEVLRAASAVALEAQPVPVSPDQFVYVRSQVITNEGELGNGVELGRSHEREIWLGQQGGAVTSDGSVIREFGQDWPLGGTTPTPAGTFRPTYGWLSALPTDPDRLLATLMNDVVVADGQEPEQALFDTVGALIGENLLPPAAAAALFESATRIPGVELTPDATDAIGRRGIGVSRTDTAFGLSTTWVFDRRSHELLGIRWYQLDGQGNRILFGATAVLERAVVDSAGVEPDSDLVPDAGATSST